MRHSRALDFDVDKSAPATVKAAAALSSNPPKTRAVAQENSRHAARRPSPGIFHLGIALTIAIIVSLGFGPTLGVRLIHPPSPRPFILFLHVALFTAWVLIFIAQTALVQRRLIDWHIRLGLLASMIGAAMPFVGVLTALSMTRLQGSSVEGQALLVVSFFDMFAFATTFWLAIWLRRRRDYHRRLMLMSSCGLTVAAFARFPSWLVPNNTWYAGVDLLILTALLRDFVVERRVHPVYGLGLPLLAIGQATAMWIYLSRPLSWLKIARELLI